MSRHDDPVENAGEDLPVDAARRVLERLRELAASLDDLERLVFASLVGPGMARLAQQLADDSGVVAWDPDALPTVLDAQARSRPRSLEVD